MALPNLFPNVPVTFTATASDLNAGDAVTVDWTFGDGGTLPPGLVINASTGAITGTPTTAASTVTVFSTGAYPVALNTRR